MVSFVAGFTTSTLSAILQRIERDSPKQGLLTSFLPIVVVVVVVVALTLQLMGPIQQTNSALTLWPHVAL